MDVFEALTQAKGDLKKYSKLVIVFPQNVPYPYPKAILDGIRKFCGFNNVDFEQISEIKVGVPIDKGTAFLIIEENDLANVIKNIRSQNLKIGRDVGILSYNDTALKEVLLEGISVISTDFEAMGSKAAKIVLNQLNGSIKNDFRLILRNSL